MYKSEILNYKKRIYRRTAAMTKTLVGRDTVSHACPEDANRCSPEMAILQHEPQGREMVGTGVRAHRVWFALVEKPEAR